LSISAGESVSTETTLCGQVRHLKPKVLQTLQEQQTIPQDAIRIPTDEASIRTYVTQSTIPGAGYGLYVAITLDGNIEIKALVGEYLGTKK